MVIPDFQKLDKWKHTLVMTQNYVTITIAKYHTISMCIIDIHVYNSVD